MAGQAPTPVGGVDPGQPDAAGTASMQTAAQLRQIDGRSAVRTRGAGTEFDSLRDYVRGDDIRSIDWRATARRQDLGMQKEPAPVVPAPARTPYRI